MSILGPLLWSIATVYDAALRVNLPTKVEVVCYEDDTLIISREDTLKAPKVTKELVKLEVQFVVAKVYERGRVGGSEVRVHKYTGILS